jgi:hypothetical protein
MEQMFTTEKMGFTKYQRKCYELKSLVAFHLGS